MVTINTTYANLIGNAGVRQVQGRLDEAANGPEQTMNEPPATPETQNPEVQQLEGALEEVAISDIKSKGNPLGLSSNVDFSHYTEGIYFIISKIPVRLCPTPVPGWKSISSSRSR